MRTQLAPPSATQTYSLVDLVALARAGRLRIPHFQRDFRWEHRDVLNLFDSIARGYPVGNLLLWRRDARAGEVRLGNIVVEAEAFPDALWVVDGQQRITSILNAVDDRGSADPRFSLCYDLTDQRFVRPPRDSVPTQIPLPVLFDLRRLLSWYNSNPELTDSIDDANEVTTQLREYRIPSYVVEGSDITVLQDVFDRMNNYGKRLRRAEVFSALYPPEEEYRKDVLDFGALAEWVDVERGFGEIDEDTVLRVVLARRGPDVAREIRLEFDEQRRHPVEFPGESRDEALEGGRDALVRAVSFLQEDCGIPHFAFLPYRYLLVVLARFFAHHVDPHERNRILLRRWLWQAALLGPEIFKGSATGAMRALCSRVSAKDETESVQALLSALGERRPQPINLTRFRTNEAATRIVLAAMWSLRPRSLLTGQEYDRGELAASLAGRSSALDVTPDILPRSALSKDQAQSAANRILICDLHVDSTELAAVLTTRPMDIEESAWQSVLRSHAADDTAVRCLAAGDRHEFIAHRQRVLDGVVQDFIARVSERNFENTPPLTTLEFDDDELDRDDVMWDETAARF